MNTIFEKIISHEIPAEIFYEDEYVIAFLDIKPVNKGHTLVVPKRAFENIFDAPKEDLLRMIEVAQKIAIALKETLNVEGVNIIMNNGSVAGQEIFHAHMHVIPRIPDDGFYLTPPVATYGENEMPEMAARLKDAIG